MARLEDITRGSSVRGILPEGLAAVLDVKWLGTVAIEVTYKDSAGRLGNELIYREREPTLEVVTEGRPWSFDGDGALFRLVSEAHRIQLAHLFDPLLAVHTSLVDPLPHQITAVYDVMLPRQPLRFLLADDPGAGKTIVTGLLIKELMVRGDLKRCLIVSPGSLVEQWQDEMDSRFHIPFEIMTNDKLEAARTGNWFHENPLAICRLDKLSRDGDVQAKIAQTDWDLIVCDEAHKLSATYFGNEIKYTKRYKLGQLLAGLTRHFLLLTATPHNGKEADFQLFMALLDGDRFEGKFRDGVHLVDTSDMMRRLVKEQLLKFDGTPLFPERIAYTVSYAFSDAEERILDQATAARTIAELRVEIELLADLEKLALQVRQSGTDRKWDELSRLLQNNSEMFDTHGHRRKLVIFTEHRDTLNYLAERIRALIGRVEALVMIHGGAGREERRKAQEAFTHDKEVEILVATDAAGEGINLQRAHLMVNYDLPWNPNRLEQRFGRIHRIGQTEVCHLWNLVAKDSREGEVYHRLLEKLDEERKALGGQVFDVLGQLTFDDRPLRELLMDAVRYGDRPEVKARLLQVVDHALDRQHLQELVESRALTHDAMDVTKVRAIREDMERAEARRLQPHFIAAFFLEAFKGLGGAIHERETKRYEIKHVPALIRSRDRQIGRGQPVLQRYERITFEKGLIGPAGKPLAAFVCPGHPLLDSTLDLVIERHRDLLKRGAILVDDNDPGDEVRALLYLEHSIQDARTDRAGNRRTVSKRLQFVEIGGNGQVKSGGYAPYLDYRPLTELENQALKSYVYPEWIRSHLENQALEYAAIHLVPDHLGNVRRRKEELVVKTLAAVKDRLIKEINHWDHQATQLKDQELAGRVNAKLNSGLARQRADELAARLQKRTAELEQERKLSALPPVLLGAALLVPAGLLRQLQGLPEDLPPEFARDTERSELLAMQAVMKAERSLGYVPRDVSPENRGYDIESSIPGTGRLRFIEVKGRIKEARTVTITKNEILTALNKPEDFILAIAVIDGETPDLRYVRRPFTREPVFLATSVNYELSALLALSQEPS
jgi:superfamily II DNA or RNA helicase